MSQLLSALVHLHARSHTHRDIKTTNILVRYRSAGTIDVMFGDFGVASNSARFQTNCGSRLYQAPELHQRHRREYTNAIDVWSLGVVGVEICHRLPRWGPRHERDILCWCDDIADRAEGMWLRVLRLMLVIDPDRRGSAQQCLEAYEPWTSADWYDDRSGADYSIVLESIESVAGGSGGTRDDASSSTRAEDRRADRSMAPSTSTRPPRTSTGHWGGTTYVDWNRSG